MAWKKWVLSWFVGSLVGLYTTFVLQSLWNWFLVRAFNAPEISFWEMYGLVLLFGLLFYKDDFADEQRWKAMSVAVDACIPETSRAEVQEAFKEQMDQIWSQIGISIFSKAVGITVTLAIGWGVHTFLI